MTFRIDYFREGIKVASNVSYETIDATRHNARRGLKMHRADEAQIRNLELANKLVERLERDPRDPER